MEKGILILIICLLAASFANAQKRKSNPDTLDFNLVNKTLKVERFNDSITFWKANTKSIDSLFFAPYNEKRKKSMDDLNGDIDDLNTYIGGFNDIRFIDAELNNLKYAIDDTKKRFPQFNIEGYERIYDFENQKEVDRKKQEILNDAERSKQQDMAFENIRQQEKQRKIDNEIAWHRKDSVENAEKYIRDSIAQVDRRINDLNYKKECIKKFGTEKGNRIARGIIKLGDTQDMCEYAWGSADDITYSTYKSGTIDIWYYRRKSTFLAFKGDKLLSITQ